MTLWERFIASCTDPEPDNNVSQLDQLDGLGAHCPECGNGLDTHGTVAWCPWCGWKDEA